MSNRIVKPLLSPFGLEPPHKYNKSMSHDIDLLSIENPSDSLCPTSLSVSRHYSCCFCAILPKFIPVDSI